MLSVESTTAERVWAAIRTRTDPSATVPEWSIVQGERADPGVWFPGQWVTDFDARNSRIEVVSAMLGAGQDLNIAPDQTYTVFVRFTPQGQTAPKVLRVLDIRVR